MKIKLELDKDGQWGGVFLDAQGNNCAISDFLALRKQERGILLWFGRISNFRGRGIYPFLLSRAQAKTIADLLQQMIDVDQFEVYEFVDQKRIGEKCRIFYQEKSAWLENITQDRVMVISRKMCPTLIHLLNEFATKASIGP